MTRTNKKLAKLFFQMADAMEILGENTFKILAYRKAARVLSDLPQDISKFDTFNKIPGIGEGISKKIKEFIETEKIKAVDEMVSKIPQGLIPLLSIQSVGPKTIAIAYNKLNVQDIESFERVLADGSLEKLPGMGTKKIENIKKGLELWKGGQKRWLLGNIFPLVQDIVEKLKEHSDAIDVVPAGSFRRMKETVGDVDILASGKKAEKLIEIFCSLQEVERVLAAGSTKASSIFQDGLQVDLRVVSPESFGSAIQYFTGSKSHNVHIRNIAKQNKLKLSEYGIFKGNKQIAGKTEEEVYKKLGLLWIPPELREDTGEIEASLKGKLPELLQYTNMKGDLHIHSKYSDGTLQLEEIARQGEQMGYEYIAVCDHSPTAKYAGGLSAQKLQMKIKAIKEINKKNVGCYLLCGAEVDILADGSLDYSNEILKQLDFVVVSIHTGFKKDATLRILKAFENPFVHAFSHPTGRLINQREGYPVDMDAVIEKARETQVALEINANAERLDLYDIYIRRAKEKGVKFVIGTDAHHEGQVWMMKLGVGMARRGWLEKKDVLNTYSLSELKDYLRRMR